MGSILKIIRKKTLAKEIDSGTSTLKNEGDRAKIL